MAPLRSPRRARGAATVELALSLVLLVPVLLYAIYAGEAFLAGTRAQEAEITAGWDLTAYRMHDYMDGYREDEREWRRDAASDTQRVVAAAVPPRVRQELGGMDSFRRDNTAPPRRTLLVSEQQLDALDCQLFNVQDRYPLLTFEGIPHGVREYLHRGSYMRCRAQVSFRPHHMPLRMREGYTSQVDLLSERLRDGFSMCGLGGSLRGCDANGGFLVLTDDWALENSRDSPVDSWRDAQNPRYARVGNAIYHRAPEPVRDLHGFEGGTGAMQVRDAMNFLLDTEDDYGDTSTFKFGFLNDASQLHRVEVEGGGMDEGHLTPWDDGEGPFPHAAEARRDPHHYLGHSAEDFNRP